MKTTALVNEAYLKLVDQKQAFANRTHFFAVASSLMRRVLVDYARQRGRMKRGGGQTPEQLDEALVVSEEKSVEVLNLDAALDKLAKLEPRQVRVVELRYFGGLTMEEIATVLRISPKIAQRDWTVARSWLHRSISQKKQRPS